MHGKTELGRIAAEKLFDLDPRDSGNHVLLSNMLASAGSDSEMALDKMWEMVRNCRLDSTVRKVRMEHIIPNSRNRVNDMSSMSTPTMD
uniref:Pentatricopeptide repeat-containing protein n=1 Tax=Zea mays TaxID=4577 RepID=A0A804MDP2_MAIZE